MRGARGVFEEEKVSKPSPNVTRYRAKFDSVHCAFTKQKRYTIATKMPSLTLEATTQSTTSETTLTEETHRQCVRYHNFRLYAYLLCEHASSCDSPSCQSSNCKKIKLYLKHFLACKERASDGGCSPCKGISKLLTIYAQQCEVHSSVPQSVTIRKCIHYLHHHK